MYTKTGKSHKGVRCGMLSKDLVTQKLGCGTNTHPIYTPKFEEYSFQIIVHNNAVLDVVNLCPKCASELGPSAHVFPNKLRIVK